jgi:hypothetical protein
MADAIVLPLRRGAAAYTDAQALNDMHALLTTGEAGTATLGDVAVILARAGRPLVPARDVEVSTTETALGWPVACVQSGDVSVFVRQKPGGPGLLVEICTKAAAEHDALTVALDGQTLHPPCQAWRPSR